MNNNSKKNIFSKKNVFIGIMILIVIFVFVYFLFLRKKEEKLLSCDFTSGYGLKIHMDAYYTEPPTIDRMDGVIEAKPVSIEPFTDINDYVSMLQSYYDNLVKGETINIKVSSENDVVFINYNIDYKNFQSSDLKDLDFIPKSNTDEMPTVNSLKESIASVGGVCVEN